MTTTQSMSTVRVDDEWRRWIAENLLLGNQPQSLHERMISAGISHAEAMHELQEALNSPYVRGAQRLRNRLAKHDWVLDNQCRLNRLRHPEIPRRHRLSREEFLDAYYTAGRPVIITGMMDDWPARSRWCPDYFKRHFGERMVEVQFGREGDAHYEINKIAHRKVMPFGEFVRLTESVESSNDFYMTAYNEGRNRTSLAGLWDDIVQLPAYLSNEGVNRGFLWLGPAGTITPLHHDLTNNFMTQVLGRKRVFVAAACEVGHVYNHEHCFSHVDARLIDLERFPLARDTPFLSCVLHPGEILFLPVGCWHFVEGLDITATVSFTNFLWDNDFTVAYPAGLVF